MITVTLHELTGAGPKQTAIIGRACQLLQAALNELDFAAMVSAAHYRQTRFEDAQRRSRSIPVAKLYEMIASGVERGTAKDNEIDLKIGLAALDEGTVGSTYLGRSPFRTAYWFINGCIADDDAISLARHFIHEWLHVSGFYHYPNNKAREDVPYVVGDIVRQLLKRDKSLVESTKMADALDRCNCGTAGAEGGDKSSDSSDARQM